MDIVSTVTTAGVDIAQLADLATRVATTGALQLAGMVDDQVFEYTVGVVVAVRGVWDS